MEALETIFTRRSIRKFTGEPIADEDLQTILRAGCYAPSATNQRPWQFVVIRKPETLQAITKFQPYSKMLPSAGCCIVVCGSKLDQALTGFLVEDCSAATQNILLAAHALGLGAVWCGLYPVPLFTKPMGRLLKLPGHVIPVGMVAVGHKAEDRTTHERFDPQKIHYETW
jgi:nitroreductase